MTAFPAVLIEKDEAGGQAVSLTRLTDADLPEGEVLVAVERATVNYKDGLAVTGKAPVVRRFPMVPGVDLAGTVLESRSPDWKPGDAVVLNGWGLGETHWGAWAGRARVKAEWLVPLPPSLTPDRAMAIGTAGYTAMLAVMALERAGLAPEKGPVLVTGAAGGVGSVAVALLARLGYAVAASTGRPEEADYLKGLGASEILPRAEFDQPVKPLAKERFAGAIDAVGSRTLANCLAATRYGGAVAACGLAGGMDLPATVAPFILRGVSLLGIDSVMCPRPLRLEAWRRLERDLDPESLDAMTQTVTLDGALETARRIVEGRVRGRVVVRVA